MKIPMHFEIGKEKTITILTVVAFGVFFNLASMPNIIKILALEYEIQFSQASKLISYYQVSYGFGALFASYLNIKISKKYSLVLSLSFYALFSYLIFIVSDFHMLIVLRALTGLAASQVIPTSLGYIGEFKKKGKKIGSLFAATSISGIIGVFSSGFIQWRLLFLIPAVISTINLVIVSILLKKETTSGSEPGPVTLLFIFKKYIATLQIRKVFFTFSGIFLNGFLLTGIYAYIGFYLHWQYGIEKGLIALILTCSALGGISGNLAGGTFIDMKKSRGVITLGFVLISINTFLLTLKLGLVFTFIILFALGMGRILVHLTLVNRFMNFPGEIKRYVTSLNSFIVFTAGSLSVFLSSILIDKIIPFQHYAIIVSCIYCLAFILMVIFIFSNSAPSKLHLFHRSKSTTVGKEL
jgi:predicted MFS family arabinose efflux permease